MTPSQPMDRANVSDANANLSHAQQHKHSNLRAEPSLAPCPNTACGFPRAVSRVPDPRRTNSVTRVVTKFAREHHIPRPLLHCAGKAARSPAFLLVRMTAAPSFDANPSFGGLESSEAAAAFTVYARLTASLAIKTAHTRPYRPFCEFFCFPLHNNTPRARSIVGNTKYRSLLKSQTFLPSSSSADVFFFIIIILFSISARQLEQEGL